MTKSKRLRGDGVSQARGECLCGAVTIEIDVPVRWAWHDHTAATRRAHGAAYATYVGAWRSKCRIVAGEKFITRFKEKHSGYVRSFCKTCGTPLMYERTDPNMVNIPRSLFAERTGREPRYHIGIEQMQEWAYAGEKLAPLRGFPGVVWERPRRKKRVAAP